MSTNERILDQIVEEVQGVIAKMDEHDLEQSMPLITKNSRVYAAGEGRSGFQARSFAMRVRMRRRSSSILVSPGPLEPIPAPPATRPPA